MNKTEALKLALEALEEIKGWTDRWTSPGHPVSTFAEKAIKPLEEALAQPEQETEGRQFQTKFNIEDRVWYLKTINRPR